MKLTELSKAQLVALAIQYKVVDSVSKAIQLAGTKALIKALQGNADCVAAVQSVKG